ncbi:uncharacterized protein LOC123310930 [Coccinella septempunctata]|uniref:uncharacterized protein LOC123310930 n=1 Tax=Coccinella septempunctata TaxID=41139 RepID=UPI001D08780F|nr:uncharacterized protein LOC123310930 [Coccinella septempunctata]
MGDYRGLPPMDFSGNISENWKIWRQKFENYLVATEVGKKDEKIQIAQLLHYIGEEGFVIYNTFTFDDEDEKNKIKTILNKFECHFLPKKNLSFERYRFFTRKQLTNEKIEQYATDLKNKARSCDFGDLKDSLIKDIFTCGLQNQTLREKLLQDDQIDLDGAIKFCVTIENSKQQASVITQESSSSLSLEVQSVRKAKKHHQFNKRPGKYTNPNEGQSQKAREQNNSSGSGRRLSKNNGICYRCGGVHGKNQCPAFGKKCNLCGKLNHYSKMCQQRNVNTVNLSENNPNENEDCLFIGNIDVNENDSSWYVLLKINDEIVKFKLDSGAQANLISMKILKLINFPSDLILKSDKILKSYTNDNLKILGKCFLNCQYKENSHKLEFFVVEEEIINENSDLFAGLGCLKQQYHIKLNENVTPIVHPPRRIPIPILNKFRETLIDLEKKNFIRKVEEPTDWHIRRKFWILANTIGRRKFEIVYVLNPIREILFLETSLWNSLSS